MKDADEIVALVRQQLCQRSLSVFGVSRKNHLAHRIDAISFEKHVLGAAKADTLRSEPDGIFHLLGRICIGSDIEFAGFVSPTHQCRVVCIALALLRLKSLADEHLDDLGGRGGYFSCEDRPRRAIDGNEIAFFEDDGRWR